MEEQAENQSPMAKTAGLLFGVLMAAAVYVLVALGMTEWGAFLVVAGVLLLVAVVLGLVGVSRLKKVKGPERAIETSKGTVAAVKGQARSPSRFLGS